MAVVPPKGCGYYAIGAIVNVSGHTVDVTVTINLNGSIIETRTITTSGTTANMLLFHQLSPGNVVQVMVSGDGLVVAPTTLHIAKLI
jgi:hypothetical protein